MSDERHTENGEVKDLESGREEGENQGNKRKLHAIMFLKSKKIS